MISCLNIVTIYRDSQTYYIYRDSQTYYTFSLHALEVVSMSNMHTHSKTSNIICIPDMLTSCTIVLSFLNCIRNLIASEASFLVLSMARIFYIYIYIYIYVHFLRRETHW